jgi:hypothetical protein
VPRITTAHMGTGPDCTRHICFFDLSTQTVLARYTISSEVCRHCLLVEYLLGESYSPSVPWKNHYQKFHISASSLSLSLRLCISVRTQINLREAQRTRSGIWSCSSGPGACELDLLSSAAMNSSRFFPNFLDSLIELPHGRVLQPHHLAQVEAIPSTLVGKPVNNQFDAVEE